MAEFKPFEVITLMEYGGAVVDGDTTKICVNAKPIAKLVRCKDCKYCYSEGFVNVRNVCEKHYDFGNVDDDWFCADGKEKNDEIV